MAYLNTQAMDFLLQRISGATITNNTSTRYLHICSATPTSYADVSTKSLGSIAFSAGDFSIANDGSGGRILAVASKTGINITTSGTATHLAIVDNANLLVVTSISNSQPVTAGNTATTSSFTIRVQAPT